MLFSDIGKPYLKQLKGYDTIPYTLNECSFSIEAEEDIQSILDKAIYDRTYRHEVIENFNKQYGNLSDGLECIIDIIDAHQDRHLSYRQDQA